MSTVYRADTPVVKVQAQNSSNSFPAPDITQAIQQAFDGMPVTVRACGLTVSQETSESEMQDIGRTLYRLHKKLDVTMRFMIGDWWRSLPDKPYGIKTRYAEVVTGLDSEALSAFVRNCWDYAGIAGKWSERDRADANGSPKYTWTYYRENKPGVPPRPKQPQPTRNNSRDSEPTRSNTINTGRFPEPQTTYPPRRLSTAAPASYGVTAQCDTTELPDNLPVEMDAIDKTRVVHAGVMQFPDWAANHRIMVEAERNGIVYQIEIPFEKIDELVNLRDRARENPEIYADFCARSAAQPPALPIVPATPAPCYLAPPMPTDAPPEPEPQPTDTELTIAFPMPKYHDGRVVPIKRPTSTLEPGDLVHDATGKIPIRRVFEVKNRQAWLFPLDDREPYTPRWEPIADLVGQWAERRMGQGVCQ